MKSLIIITAGTTAVFFILSTFISCSVNDSNQTITPVLIGKGILSGAGDEGIPQQNIVISDTAAWNELKNKMDSVSNITGTFTETEIDFSNYMILAAFSPVRPSGGYSIEIKSIIESPGSIEVIIENVIPTGFVTASITQPYHIVKIPKSDNQIVFTEM